MSWDEVGDDGMTDTPICDVREWHRVDRLPASGVDAGGWWCDNCGTYLPKTRCTPLTVDGTTVRVQGDPDMSPEAQDALRDVVRAARARFAADPEADAMAARQAARIAEIRARVGLK